MIQKTLAVVLYAIPIIVMIGLIPFVQNDYLLALLYGAFSLALLSYRSENNDILAFVFGLVVITVSEYFFIRTGVETFARNSFLGVMPLWLPILWAYAFVTIKRTLRILDRD